MKAEAMVTDQQILDVLSTTEPRPAGEIAALICLSPRFQLSHIRSRLLTLRDDGAVRKADGGKPPRWLKTGAMP